MLGENYQQELEKPTSSSIFKLNQSFITPKKHSNVKSIKFQTSEKKSI